MQSKWMIRAILAGAVAVGMCGTVVAQESAKQDMKDVGHETKDAAKHTGNAVKKGTKKAYHKTKSGVHHTAAKVEEKTAPSPQ
jgi:hypothetical protein